MNEISITAEEFRRKNYTELPKLAGDFSRNTFWQYTRLINVDLILDSSAFRIRNLNAMNDLDEAKAHETKKEKVFVASFCNSDTEKIPLWYLYSGITGEGAAIGLTPSRMINWIKSVESVWGVKEGQKKEEGSTLQLGIDVEIRYGWVYYQKSKEPNKVKYRNVWYRVDDVSKFQDDNYFIKYYPWEYEKEFRVVFLNRSKEDFDAIFVDVPEDIMGHAKVKLAPEIKEDRFKGLAGLKHVGVTHQPTFSELEIKMDLLSRSEEDVYGFFYKELEKRAKKIDVGKICGILKKQKKCENFESD